MTRTVFLMPGQGCYRPGAFAGRFDQDLAEVFDTVDRVAREFGHEPVSGLLHNPGGPSASELGRADSFALQLAIYAAGLGWYRLASRTRTAHVLVGHSMGEFAALTAAGAFDVADGARLVCHRSMALLAGAPRPGGMVALGLNARRTAGLVELVDTVGLAVAVRNAPVQTVVSGSEAGLAAVAAVAHGLGVSATRLSSPFPYHSSLLAGVGPAFAADAAGIRQRPLTTLVFSPVAGRYLDDTTDAKALLTDQLTRPVDFLTAIRELHADGATEFVECGQAGLGKLVELTVPGMRVDSVATIEPPASTPAGFPEAGANVFGAGGADGFGPSPAGYFDQPATTFGSHPAPAFGTQPAPAFGGQPSTAFGAQPSTAFGAQPSTAFGAQPSTAFGGLPAPAFGSQPAFGQPSAGQPVLGQPVSTQPPAGSEPTLPPPPVVQPTLVQPATIPAAVDQPFTGGQLPDGPGPVGQPSPPSSGAGATDPAAVAEVLAELLSLYASTLGYPQEAISADADLEADLGIDSLKRAEMLGKVRAHFGLEDAGDDGRFLTQSTLGELAELVTAAR